MGIEEIVLNWIRKAESDLKTAKDEILTENPATDTICFHNQQCVEKYLKAFLIYHKRRFGKTHNIAELIKLCKEIDGDFEKLYEMRQIL
jgi:HEPN domain-containing protein